YSEFTFFGGCACVDPRAPRCDEPNGCNVALLPFTHCADPSKVCVVTLAGSDGDNLFCAAAHCGDPESGILPPTTVTSTTTTTTTTTSTSSSTTTTVACLSA